MLTAVNTGSALANRTFLASAALVFAILVALNYYPVFLGRVPLPTDTIIWFPTFQSYQGAAPANTLPAEMGDTVSQFYPWRMLAGKAIREGELPLWNPHLLSGSPFQADPMIALFYPLNWLFVVLPAPIAWSISLMLKVLLAGVFTALFVRQIGGSTTGSIVAGTAFAFGGFMTAWIGWTHTDTSLWLPLICLLIHRQCQEPGRVTTLLLAVALAMPLLSGHPGMAAFVWAASAAFGLWTLFSDRPRSLIAPGRGLLVAGVLSMGLAAVQVLPSAEWLGQIDRTLDVRWHPLPLSSAIGLFSRDLYTNPNSAGVPIPLAAVYVGALCLLAAAYAVLSLRLRQTLFFTVVLAVSFCAAYGIPPILDLYDRTPVFRGLKKEEALLLVDFCLAVLAGLGVSHIENSAWREIRWPRRMWITIALLSAGSVLHFGAAVLSKMTATNVDWWRSPRSFRVLVVVGTIVLLLRLVQVMPRRSWAVIVVSLCAIDMLTFSHAHFPFNDPRFIFPKAAIFDFLAAQEKPFRVVSLDNAAMTNIEPVYGLSSAVGYDFFNKRLAFMTDDMREPSTAAIGFTAKGVLAANHRVLDLMNAKYLIATRFNESLEVMRSAPDRFHEVWSDGAVTVFENPRVLPRAFLLAESAVEIYPTESEELIRLRDPSFDPARSVILSGNTPQATGDATTPAPGVSRGHVERYVEGTNWVRMDVKTPEDSVLVLNQIHYPGWTATVNGRIAPVLRTNYAFTGTRVPAGSHVVEFRFLPKSFVWGAALSLCSVLLIVGAGTITIVGRRRHA